MQAHEFAARALSAANWEDCLATLREYDEASAHNASTQRILAAVWQSQSAHLRAIRRHMARADSGRERAAWVVMAKTSITNHARLLSKVIAEGRALQAEREKEREEEREKEREKERERKRKRERKRERERKRR